MAFSVFLSFFVWDYFLKTAGLLQRDEVISVQSNFLRNEEQIYQFFRCQATCIVDVFAQSLSGLRHFTELNCRMRITHLITVKENLFVKSSWSRTFLYCINMVITVCNGRVPVKTNAMQIDSLYQNQDWISMKKKHRGYVSLFVKVPHW